MTGYKLLIPLSKIPTAVLQHPPAPLTADMRLSLKIKIMAFKMVW